MIKLARFLIFSMKAYGFTLIESLIAIVVLIFGFSILISAQNYFMVSSFATFEEVDIHSVAKNVSILLSERAKELSNFQGDLRAFLNLYNLSNNSLKLSMFDSFRISVNTEIISKVVGEDVINFKKVSFVVFGSKLSKSFEVLLPLYTGE